MNYPTTETDAFENAIKAAPDDDAPLLVYADWVQRFIHRTVEELEDDR